MLFAEMFKKVRTIALAAITACIWLFLIQAYLDRFLPPFDRAALLLMPWKRLSDIPADATLFERLSYMQTVLESSQRLASYVFAAMLLSVASLVIYLTVTYQQKQQRMRENRFLQLKNQEIARRTEFIRYIAATIGHEFKNNLGRIKRRIDLLAGLPPDAKERIDVNLSNLFADIDIFKKISDEREAGLIAFTRVDLRELLAAIARSYADIADISFRENAAPPHIYASRELLTTVIENVIDNAVKYRKPEQDRASITVTSGRDRDDTRDYVTLSFRDEGMGMDEQQAAQCFYKGKESREGWGQGLYFAKYVVGLHAGKIRIGMENTAPGKGAEVILNLPLVEESLDV